MLLGSAMNNPALMALYRRKYVFVDDFYPGGGGVCDADGAQSGELRVQRAACGGEHAGGCGCGAGGAGGGFRGDRGALCVYEICPGRRCTRRCCRR